MSRLISNVQRILKRMDRSLSGPIVEFSEQFLYGHREILIDYAGLGATALIKGSVEHGWALDSGRGIRKFSGGRYLYLSWAKARVARSKVTDSTTIAIGAPFIYAHSKVQDEIRKFQVDNATNKERILFFPVHGNEFSQQNPESQIALFSEKYNPKGSTVCLYWVEFINPYIHGLYRQAGFRIVCSGFSGQMEHTGLGYSARRLAGSPIGGRQNFILNTIAMMSTHTKIIFGGLGSSLFYASYLQKDIELLHRYVKTTFLDMDSESGTSFEDHPDESRYIRYIAEYMNCKFDEIDYNSKRFQDLANLELGKADMLTPELMHDLLKKNVCSAANPQSLKVYQESIEKFSELLEIYNK